MSGKLKDDGGSAFPSHGSMGEVVCEGMTLRDFFAAKAMVIKFGPSGTSLPAAEFARQCYEIADAMIEARSK